MAYSPFFHVLHDERAPVGNLGRGTHYSIVRTLLPVLERADPTSPEEQIFATARRRRLEQFDLAIIWDEDHDERIWDVIERIHAAGLLAPIRFIGERKGSVTIVTDPTTDYGEGGFERYVQLLEKHMTTSGGDEWSLDVLQGIGGGTGQLANAAKERVDAYLRGIQAVWSLGPSAWAFQRNKAPGPI